MFDELKAAHVAAFFLSKTPDRRMNVLKLMKLMYLAERESYRVHGEPIIGDQLVSMPHGPVLSMTYSHTNGEPDPTPDGWDGWIADREDFMVALKRPVGDLRVDLDRLSDSDLSVLDNVWDRFGAMSPFQIRDWTHENCSEWDDPGGGSQPIEFERLFKEIGYSGDDARKLAKRVEAYRFGHRKLRAIA